MAGVHEVSSGVGMALCGSLGGKFPLMWMVRRAADARTVLEASKDSVLRAL